MKNIFDKKIESERLLFRRLSHKDTDDIFEYTSDIRSTQHLSWEPHRSKKQVTEFIDKSIQDYEANDQRYTWGISLKKVNKLIGVISIFNISHISKRVEVSYILNPSYQGKGYMTEALNSIIDFIFNELDFIRVEAKCTEANKASENLMKKVNMEYEGTLKKFWNIKNTFKNVLIYAIIKQKE